MTKVRFEPSRGTHRHRVQSAIAAACGGAPGDGDRGDDDDVAARWLAGAATFGDRDGARALRLLGDESRRVRGIALVVAPLACDDAQAAEALRVAWSIRGERRLLRRMARRERTRAIDRFLDGLAAEGQLRDLVDDLPFGSAIASCAASGRPRRPAGSCHGGTGSSAGHRLRSNGSRPRSRRSSATAIATRRRCSPRW